MSRDEAQLLDMLLACQKIQRYATGLDGTAFLADELRQDGILRQLTVLGEAAKRVSSEYRTAHPEVPWQDIAGFRDVVVHQYARVQLPRVWEIVTRDLVAVKGALECLLSRPKQEP